MSAKPFKLGSKTAHEINYQMKRNRCNIFNFIARNIYDICAP